MAKAYEKKRDFKSAYESLERHKELSDSIINTASNEKISELETGYRVELKEQENKKLEAQIAEKQAIKQRDDLLKWGLSILVFLLLFLMYFTYRSYQLKMKRQEQELNHRKASLYELKEAMKQKNELLLHLESKLTARDNTEDFAEELLQKFSTENDWSKFITQFNLLHPGFIDDLTKKHQKLTANDLRIAALVKLQLSEKEMAELLCVVPDAVKKAKSRLKKKLSLEKGEPLFEYLLSLN